MCPRRRTIGEAHGLQHRLHPRASILKRPTKQAQGQLHVARNVKIGQQMKRLKYEANQAAPREAACALIEVRKINTFDRDCTAIGCLESGQQIEQRRLAGTRFTDHGNDLAAGDLQIQTVEHQARTEVFGQRMSAQGDGGRGGLDGHDAKYPIPTAIETVDTPEFGAAPGSAAICHSHSGVNLRPNAQQD